MPFTAEINQRNPTCILLIVDETASMAHPRIDCPAMRRCDIAAHAVNRFLQGLVFRCSRGSTIRDHFYVGVVRYGATVGSAWGGALAGRGLAPISEIGNHPLRVDVRTKQTDDGAGNIIERRLQFPVWYEAQTAGSATAAAAFSHAVGLLEKFVAARPSCFPPLVFHLTGGESLETTDGEFAAAAVAIKAVQSDDGPVLLINQYLDGNSDCSLAWPGAGIELPDARQNLLLHTASEFPEPVIRGLSFEFPDIQPSARGYLQNEELSRFMRVFELVQPPLRRPGG